MKPLTLGLNIAFDLLCVVAFGVMADSGLFVAPISAIFNFIAFGAFLLAVVNVAVYMADV